VPHWGVPRGMLRRPTHTHIPKSHQCPVSCSSCTTHDDRLYSVIKHGLYTEANRLPKYIIYKSQLEKLSQYSVRLQERTTQVPSPAEAKDVSSSLCVQTGSEAHPASGTMGTGGPFPGVKRGRGVTLNTLRHLVPRST
jgi:hypothetical protein